jgi:hypothetical protein
MVNSTLTLDEAPHYAVSLSDSYFIPLRLEYSPELLILKHRQYLPLPYSQRPV